MGSNPRWARDGTLYFLRQDGSIVATRVTAEGGAPVFGKEERSSSSSRTTSAAGSTNGWDVSPDGRRFLVLVREGAATSLEANHVTLASDFAAELERLVPTGGK